MVMQLWNAELGYLDSGDGFPDSKVHGANMGPIWGRQDPGGPYVGPMNFAIWVVASLASGINLGTRSTDETMLQCNTVSHWLIPYPEWSLSKKS